MTRIVKAELIRLLRRRTLVIAAAGSVLFSIVATLTVFSSAETSGAPSRDGGTTLAALAREGGGTEVFGVGASFVGFLVFVSLIGLVASEFSGGTFRALLLREPHRLRLIVGKLTGTLVVLAGIVAFVEVLTFLMSLAAAPSREIATASWFSFGGAAEAMRDFLTVFGGVAGWAIFGTTLAVVFRSVPIALAVGFAWAGPFENIVVESWKTGYLVFPGQVLGSFIRGGTIELGMGRAVLTAAVYTGLAAVLALVLVSRRDVTA